MHAETSTVPVALLNDSWRLAVRPPGHGESSRGRIPGVSGAVSSTRTSRNLHQNFTFIAPKLPLRKPNG